MPARNALSHAQPVSILVWCLQLVLWTADGFLFHLFFWSISVYPAGRQQARPKHVWAVALLKNLTGAVKPRICSGAQCLAYIPRVPPGPGNIHLADSRTLGLLIPLSAVPPLYSSKWGSIGHVIRRAVHSDFLPQLLVPTEVAPPEQPP